MAVRQARRHTAEEGGGIVISVPEDSNNSDFKGGEGDPESGMVWESINIIYAENGHAIVHSIGYFNSFIMIHNKP